MSTADRASAIVVLATIAVVRPCGPCVLVEPTDDEQLFRVSNDHETAAAATDTCLALFP